MSWLLNISLFSDSFLNAFKNVEEQNGTQTIFTRFEEGKSL